MHNKKDEFLETHKFDNEPSHYAKMMSSHTKRYLLETFARYIAFEEAEGEQVYGETAGTILGNTNMYDQLNGFNYWLKGDLEGMKECMDEYSETETA